MPIPLNLRPLFPPEKPPDGNRPKQDTVRCNEADAGVQEARCEIITMRAQRAPSFLTAAEWLPSGLLGRKVTVSKVGPRSETRVGVCFEDALRLTVDSHGRKSGSFKTRSAQRGLGSLKDRLLKRGCGSLSEVSLKYGELRFLEGGVQGSRARQPATHKICLSP
jgi:hypothetical protein